MATRDQTKKHILRAATKSPMLARDLGARMDKNNPGNGYADARTFGRPLGELANEGKIIKSGPKSRPLYAKA